MGLYELMVLVPPDLEEPSKNQITKFLKETIASAGGSISSDKDFGKRELAYPIVKNSFAQYLYFEVEIPPESVAVVDGKLRINETVIRHLLVKKEKVRKKPGKKQKTSVSEKTETEMAKVTKGKATAKKVKVSKGKREVKIKKSKIKK